MVIQVPYRRGGTQKKITPLGKHVAFKKKIAVLSLVLAQRHFLSSLAIGYKKKLIF